MLASKCLQNFCTKIPSSNLFMASSRRVEPEDCEWLGNNGS